MVIAVMNDKDGELCTGNRDDNTPNVYFCVIIFLQMGKKLNFNEKDPMHLYDLLLLGVLFRLDSKALNASESMNAAVSMQHIYIKIMIKRRGCCCWLLR